MLIIQFTQFMESIFVPSHMETLFYECDPSFAPVTSWDTQPNRPHIMFTMRNEAEPTADEQLLLGELLAIMTAIISPICFRRFQRHTVVPVCTCLAQDPPPSSHFIAPFTNDLIGHGPLIHGPPQPRTNPSGLSRWTSPYHSKKSTTRFFHVRYRPV